MNSSAPSLPPLQRNSNGELLRLLCMLMIVLHHFTIHSLYPATTDPSLAPRPWDEQLVLSFHCFIYIGVNCFVLLSGWYSIRLKPRSVVNLWSVCFFYAVACFVEVAFFSPHSHADMLSWKYIAPVLLPFSHSPFWFIQCYVALLLLSPLLNSAIGALSRKRFLLVIVLASVLNVWFGFLWSVDTVNIDGYNAFQFLYLYLLGAFLHSRCNRQWLRKHRYHCLLLYVGCSLLWGLLASTRVPLLELSISIPFRYNFRYNNPLVLGAAIGFFLFVLSFEFRSKTINRLAASTLAVYLVQEGLFRYRWLPMLLDGCSPFAKLAMLLPVSLGFMLAVFALDQLRILLMRPLWHLYDSRLAPRIDSFLSRWS